LTEFERGSSFFAGGIGSLFVFFLFLVGLVVFLGGDSLKSVYIVVAGCEG
jgi:hypothetical protein